MTRSSNTYLRADRRIADPNVQDVSSFIGAGGSIGTLNTGRMFIDAQAARRAREDAAGDGLAAHAPCARCPASRSTCGRSRTCSWAAARARAATSTRCRACSADELSDWAEPAAWSRMRADPTFRDVTSDSQNEGPAGVAATSTATSANMLGVQIGDVRNALYDAFGERQVSTIYSRRNSYQVIMEARRRGPPLRGGPVARSTCAAATARWCRCRASRTVERTVGPDGRQPPGPAAGDHDLVQPRARTRRWATPPARSTQFARELKLPPSIITSYGGDAAVFQDSQGSQAILLVVGAARDLRAARRAVRELHPPADDPRRPAFGGGGRAADAASCSAST